jgi:hypothetical protein
MSSPTKPALLTAFDPRVTAFRTNTFALAEDLEWLDRMRELRAPVAVVLHAARILEVLSFQALALAGLAERAGREAPRLNDVLRRLADYERMPHETFLLLDRLRGLGNQARHALSMVRVADAEQGYAIALHGLNWYFCRFAEGPGLPCLCLYNQPLDALLPFDVAALLTMLESNAIPGRGFLTTLRLDRPDCPLLTSPVLAAVLIERLLDGGRTDEAQAVLTPALTRFADDVRLRQLQGLLHSRAGRLEQACSWLEAIEATDSQADEETQGILAGAYKRRAAEPARRAEWLAACHEKYQRGWHSSRQTNAYLGVNAAATGLWLRLPGWEQTAARVRRMLEARSAQLAQAGRRLNCWDQLTLAEARLLLKDWDAARDAYREAAERFAGQKKALQVARDQAREDLAALGRPDLAASIVPD